MLASVQRLIARIGRFTRDPLPPSDWLRAGSVPPLLVALMATASFPLAGVVRTVTGCGMGMGLLASAALLLVALALFWPALRRPGHRAARPHAALTLAAMALVAGLACFCLYNHYFAGLPTYRGTDAGFHVDHYRRFVTSEPRIYAQFVAMFSALYFAQHALPLSLYWALVFVFYACVAVVCILPLSVTFALVWPVGRASRSAYAVGVAAAVVASALVQYLVVLPQQHQNQADGFYPHLFSLPVLLAAWVVDALVLVAPLRMAALLGTFALCRFTYGLNLGDFAATLVVLFVLDACRRHGRAWWRGVALAGAVALAVVAYEVFTQLWPLRYAEGFVLGYDIALASRAQALGLVALALMAAATLGEPASSGLRAAVRFPFWFGLFNLGVMLAYLRSGAPRLYYFVKYPLAGIVFVALALAALLPVVVAQALAAARGRRLQLSLLAVACALPAVRAVDDWQRSIPQQRRFFAERAWGGPQRGSQDNLPLADLGAWRRIEETLAREHKRFGGYVVSHFGMTMFMNAALDVPGFNWSAWFGGPQMPPVPGSCVFWDEGPPSDWSVWERGFPLRTLRAQLRADPGKQCSAYRAHWNPDGPARVLCHHCY